jgi:hypothetical protein
VKNLEIAQSATPRASDRDNVAQRPETFTPGRFFQEAGTTIAVCLGLALVAQVLWG